MEGKLRCATLNADFTVDKADLIAILGGLGSPPKRRVWCDSKDRFNPCDKGKICNERRNCVTDTKRNRTDQWSLKVEDRDYDIVGSKDHIDTLKKLLGGKITRPKEARRPTSPSKAEMDKARREFKTGKPTKKPAKRESVDLDPGRADIIKTFNECLAKLDKQR